MTSTAIESADLADLAGRANEDHRRCLAAANDALSFARAAGDSLVKAKRLCQYGTWGQWLADNFTGSARTARAYMQIFTRWPEIEAEAQRQSAAILSIDGALRLLPPSPPKKPKVAEDELPDLQPGLRYGCVGSNDDIVEIDPVPHADGYFYLCHYRNISSDAGGFCDYTMRGFKGDVLLSLFMRFSGFRPSGPWQSEPATGEVPWYVPAIEERWALEKDKPGWGREELET